MPHFHQTGDDDPVDRRLDHRVRQVQFGCFEHRLRLLDRRICHGQLRRGAFVGGHRHIHVVLGNELLLDERLHTVQFALALGLIDFRFQHGRLRVGETGGGLIAPRPIGKRVNPGDDLIFFHDGIEVRVQAFDHPGYLAADLHHRDGIDRARRVDHRDDGAPLHRRRLVADRHLPFAAEEHVASDGDAHRQNTNDPHRFSHRWPHASFHSPCVMDLLCGQIVLNATGHPSDDEWPVGLLCPAAYASRGDGFTGYFATLIRSLIASNLALGSAFFKTISCVTV